MMHRYVALIATDPSPAFAAAAKRLQPRVQNWAKLIDSDLAVVWALTSPPSQLGYRQLAPEGCLIGLDFGSPDECGPNLSMTTWGAYVAVRVDRQRKTVSVLRDPTGRVECWHLSLPGVDVLFSHYQDVYWLQRTAPEINWEFLAHQLNQDYLHGEATGLHGVTELLPGEEISYSSGYASKQIYWWPHEIAADPYPSLTVAQQNIRRAAELAVSAWADRYERISLDLSGGLDSSIVLGLLRQHAGHPNVIGINRVTPGEEGDERDYALAAAAMHGIELVEQRPIATDVDFSTRLPRRLMRPRHRMLPLGYDEAGVELAHRYATDAFFTGTGGDHLFYDHLPVEAARDYLHHGGSVRGFVAAAVRQAQLSKNTVWGVASAVLKSYAKGTPSLRELGLSGNIFLSDDAKRSLNPGAYMHPAAAAAAAAATMPPAKLNQILSILELQRHYYRFGRADVAQETHVLFSQPLLEAALRTPAHWFGVGGVQRGLARRAFADLLPASVLSRRSKGGISPYMTRFVSVRLAKIRELLLDGQLCQRNLLDRGALERELTPLAVTAGKGLSSIVLSLAAELWIRQTEADRLDAKAEFELSMAET